MNLKTVIIFIFAVFAINETAAQTERQEQEPQSEDEILEALIPNFNQLSQFRPVSSENASAPVNVTVSLYVRNLRILEPDNEYNVQLTFRQQWRDERLSYTSRDSSRPYVSLLNSKNSIWQPDTFFDNELDGKYHELMTRNQYIRISPNGTVLKSVRISLRLTCPMIYRNFPLDKQTCSIRLKSYGFTNRDLVFTWIDKDPVLTSVSCNTPIFELKNTTTGHCDSHTNTGIYSCLRVDLTFQRVFHSYLVMVYIPSMMMVFVSWVSFWITPKAVTARTILATMTLFVLAIQVNEANKKFPQTSYTKAVDVWTGVCLTFVFATLLEFATVHYLSNLNEKNSSAPAASKNDEDAGIQSNGGGGDEEQEIPQKDMSPRDGNKGYHGQKERVCRLARNLISKLESSSHRLDVVSRIAFPGLFILFNIFYWSAYAF